MILNQTQQVTKAGLQPGKKYKAVVTNNADPEKSCRVKFKIEGFFEFKNSPWAISHDNDADGSTTTSGKIRIPKVGSKIMVEFQGGSPYHPIYYPAVHDKSNKVQDADKNYPDRMVERFSNGLLIVYDTKTNEIFIENPGDASVKIKGSVNVTVLEGNLAVSVNKGNSSLYVKGDCKATVEGEMNATVTKDVIVKAEGMASIKAKTIYLDGGSGDCVGVITGKSVCQVTGAPHIDPSTNVYASTGGS
jgi:phage baseplate assembly protein gpV